MKKILLSLSTTLILTTSSHAVDVVIDPAHIAETAAGWAAEVERWKELLINTTGIRDAVQFVKDLQQLQSIMDEWKIDLMDLNIDDPKSQIGVLAKQLFDKYQVFDDCNVAYLNETRQKNCKDVMVRSVQEVAAYQSYSTQLQTFSNKLKDLSVKLAASKNQKESLDISNAISMQMSQLQVTKAQMEIMRMNNLAKADIASKQNFQIQIEKATKVMDLKGW